MPGAEPACAGRHCGASITAYLRSLDVVHPFTPAEDAAQRDEALHAASDAVAAAVVFRKSRRVFDPAFSLIRGLISPAGLSDGLLSSNIFPRSRHSSAAHGALAAIPQCWVADQSDKPSRRRSFPSCPRRMQLAR